MNNTDQQLQYRESLKLITNALNKACKSGAFLLDESYIIKIALSNLEKAVDIVEKAEQLEKLPELLPTK